MTANVKTQQHGPSAEERAMELFANLMIEKISNIQQDWKKPWFTPKASQPPQNLNGRPYNGMNSIILMMMQEKNGWNTSRYATFDRITAMNYEKNKEGKYVPAVDKDGNKLPLVSIIKGEKSTPVMITTFTCIHAETKEHIKYDDYRQLSESDRAEYNVYPKMQVFNVFKKENARFCA